MLHSKPVDPEQCRRAILDYKAVKPQYDLLSDYLQALLRKIADDLDMYPIIQGRAKSLESYSEKIYRKGKDYKDPLNELTDLCGVRFITHTLDEVEKVKNILEDYFTIDRENSEDKKGRLSSAEFGYLSAHYIVQLKNIARLKGFDFEEIEKLKPLKAELQLRTLAQHIWADVYHEAGYKNEFQLPGKWEREFARVAAFLENCDKSFQDIKDDISSFESNYSNYMDHWQLKSLVDRLEVLTEIDTDNKKALHRLIKAYVGLSEWKKIEELYNSKIDLLEDYYPVLRDTGMAICKANAKGSKVLDEAKYLKGQALIEKALSINPHDFDAFCCLGGTYYKLKDLHKAREYYKKAHHLDPVNPYPLGNFIACDLLIRKNSDILEYFYPLIEGAAARCLRQVEVRTNLPWALYDLGLFNIYLDKPDVSLLYYAKALATSAEDWMVASGRSRIDDFLSEGVRIAHLENASALLRLGQYLHKSDPSLLSRDYRSAFKEPCGNVLFVSGGCGYLEDNYRGALDLLEEKLFNNFKTGTVVSGGTRSGTSNMVGNLQERNDRAKNEDFRTIGYLPHESTDELDYLLDKRYKVKRYTDTPGFSIEQTLKFWSDFLCAGGNPENVKLIGFNGGQISSCEFRIALAFGVKTGIVRNSGRQADTLLNDPLWQDNMSKNLFALDLNDDSIEKFLASE